MKDLIIFFAIVFFVVGLPTNMLQAQVPEKPFTALMQKSNDITGKACFDYLRTFAKSNTALGKIIGGNAYSVHATLACRLADYLYYVKNTLGCSPVIHSGYRTFDEQKVLYKRYLDSGRSKDKTAAPPGGSCHNFGAAVDITGASKGKDCNAATGDLAGQFGLIFGYSRSPNVPAANRKNGRNHFQCIENKVSGGSSCRQQVCGGKPPNTPPPTYNTSEWDYTRETEQEFEGNVVHATEEEMMAPLDDANVPPAQQLPQGPITPEQLQDQPPVLPEQDSGSIFDGADSIFAENENDIFCAGAFGNCNESTATQDLLTGAGTTDATEEYVSAGSENPFVGDAVVCGPGETPALNSPGACVAAGEQQMQAEGGVSVTNTIRNAPSISEGVTYLLTGGRSSDVGELFAWGSQQTAPNRYLSMQFHSPQDGTYGSNRNGQSYYSDGVPDDTIISFAASNDPQFTQTSGFSFDGFFRHISFSLSNAVSTQFGIPYFGPGINAFSAWWR